MLGSFMGVADGQGGVAGTEGGTLIPPLAGCIRANPRITSFLNQTAGNFLTAFGIQLAISK